MIGETRHRRACWCDLFRRAIVFVALTSLYGCIVVPFPHRRHHLSSVEGVVVDADSGRPIVNADVTVFAGRYSQCSNTDKEGRFVFVATSGWHWIFWIATPSSGSLMPTHVDHCDGGLHKVRVDAMGYPSQVFDIGTANEGGVLKPVCRITKEIKEEAMLE